MPRLRVVNVWCFVAFIWLPVRVIRFHESPSSSRLVLRDLLLCMGAHVLMHLDVAGNAQQLAVVGIVTPCTHSVWSFNRLRLFDRSDVMHVHAWGYEALSLAQLAQAVGTSEHLGPQQLPPLVIQQSLVSWVSAHRPSSLSNRLSMS